jgi:hypothetical protein
MDADRFDALSRTLTREHTRRSLVRLLFGLSLGGVLSVLGTAEVFAGSRLGGAPCTRGRQCQTGRCVGKKGHKKCTCSTVSPKVGCKQPTGPCKTAVCKVETQRCATQNICREASCTNGVLTLQASCDSTGTCPPAVTQNCVEGYQCHESGTACVGVGGCGGPDDCTSTHHCSSGKCEPKKANGESCAIGTQCVSGFCSPADHICCDTGCDAAGQTCPGGTCTCPTNQSVCGLSCAPIGQPCDGNDGDLCPEGVLICDNGNVVCSDISGTTVEIPGNGADEDCNPQPTD